MSSVPASAVSTTQLVTGIIGTVDVATLVSESIKLQDDINRATAKLKEIQTVLQGEFNNAQSEAVKYANTEGLNLVSEFKTTLPQDMNVVTQNAYEVAIQGAGGYRVSATTLSLWAKLYSTFNHLDLKSKALIEIPESLATLRIFKYYNKLIAPNLPNERDFSIMVANGFKPLVDFVDQYQTLLGLNAKDAQNVANIRQWQTGKPPVDVAWIMARKGLVPDSYFYNIAKLGLGFTDVDAKALYQNFYYQFSPMELFRISDLTPVPSTWIDKKLSGLGFNDEDKALVAQMILARTIKTEINQAWVLIQDNYAWGLATEDQLTTFCSESNIPQIEIDAKLNVANLLRSKIVQKLMRDAQIYLYRKSGINEDQLLTSLQDLGISLDVANAITRNEACKKGIDWEIPSP